MYSRIMTTEKKEQVLSNFSSKNDSTIEMIIATSAFGLGVDCFDIRRIIHWGLPTTIEEYVQEAGKGLGEMGSELRQFYLKVKLANSARRK